MTGMVRRPPSEPLGAAEHLRDRVELVDGELLDPTSLAPRLRGGASRELYHLAAPSFVPDSWESPAQTSPRSRARPPRCWRRCATGDPTIRVFVAASGAMFGAAPGEPAARGNAVPARALPTRPRSSPRTSWSGQLRAHDGLYACSGILYNHESERRPEWFVTRKITRAAAAIELGVGERGGARRPGCRPGLVLRGRHRGGGVADAPAGAAGRLHPRERRAPHGEGPGADGVRVRGAGRR